MVTRPEKGIAKPGLLYPESTDPKLTRPSGSGNLAQKSRGHGNPGFALVDCGLGLHENDLVAIRVLNRKHRSLPLNGYLECLELSTGVIKIGNRKKKLKRRPPRLLRDFQPLSRLARETE